MPLMQCALVFCGHILSLDGRCSRAMPACSKHRRQMSVAAAGCAVESILQRRDLIRNKQL